MSDLFELIGIKRDTQGAGLTLSLVVWGIILGMIVAWIIGFYRQRIIGAFVDAIISAGAKDEESAKTLAELGQEFNSGAMKRYRTSGALRSLVRATDIPEGAKSPVTVDENTRFFIPETAISAAEKQFGARGANVWIMIGGSAALIIIGTLITYFL